MAAPSAIQFFAKTLNLLKESDLSGFTFKLLLTTSAYTPDTTATGNQILTDVTNELANANGYSTGGASLATPAVAVYGTTGYKFSTGNGLWTASGSGIPAWRNAVIYIVGTQWGLVSPLLGYYIGDSTPADIPLTASGNSLQLNCPANGWFTITRT